MERLTRIRARLLMLLFCLVLGFFALKLYDMLILETGGHVDNTKTFITETLVKAARGDILDRNGNVLVTNRASYNLVFNHYVICSAENTNGLLLDLVHLCRELDIDFVDHFPVTKQAPFTYTLNQQNASWQGYFQAYLLEKGGLDSDITAPLLVQKLRKLYRLPEEWSDEDARDVIGIRYELDLRQDITNLPLYVFLSDAESQDLAAVLELNTPGLKAQASTVRQYNTKYGAHILGYVGPITKKQWEETYKNKPGYPMDALVGQDGLEEAFEEYLHGTDGILVEKVTTDGTVVESHYKTVDGKEMRPIAGKNVELSIDINLQASAEEEMRIRFAELRASGENLKEGEKKPDGSDVEGGAVVVMDVRTGEILACASYPTYDLSTFREDYNELMQAKYGPLFNRALLAEYPPGSTYKMSMTVAGVNSGKIDCLTKIRDEGVYTKYKDSGFAPECMIWTQHGTTHGTLDVMHALAVSCNYFFYDLAERITIEQIDEAAKGLGLGEPTGMELFERLGRRSNPETKAKIHKGDKARWYPADTILTSIGQSDNLFTPAQLCVYTSTLANRGVRYKATFLNRVLSPGYDAVVFENQPEIASKMEISDETYKAYSEGMRLVCTEGTGWETFGRYPIPVAAKTGTAETDAGVDASDNAAFVCYAPYEKPEIAIAVYGEKAGHGKYLGSIARGITDTYFNGVLHGDVMPGENHVS